MDGSSNSSEVPTEPIGELIGEAGGVDELEAQRVLAAVERRMFEGEAPPVRLSRYLLLRPLGSGGAGVVYDGYDPELARRVAIKVLRPDRRDREAAARARVRFLREAQSIARLSHPNVIAVYDVGTYSTARLDRAMRPRADEGSETDDDDAVFIVMEVVDGTDVRAWLDAAKRSWREVLDVFIAAGRGLAAAHTAGVIHRDFKPGNVLVGNDGRVKVVDFGLALTYQLGPDPSGERPTVVDSVTDDEPSAASRIEALAMETPDSGAWDGDKLTRTGMVLGTPVYMAPEQHAGHSPDQKADQFAFCASLYRALYGRFPFAGNDVDALYARKAKHRIRPPPEPTQVPPWLWRIIQRGMAPQPAERYADMPALLHALVNDPGRRVRRLARASTVPIAAVALAYSGWTLTRPGEVSVVVQSRGEPVAGIRVYVDDDELTVTEDRARGEVSAGLHRVRVVAPDHLPTEAVVEVQRGGTHEVALELAHEQGTFDLEVDPRGGSVLIDGTDFGSRLTNLKIDTGPHDIVVRHEGYEDVQLAWTARAGQTERGFVSLRRALVWSQPMSGTDPFSAWIGDANGDGRSELVHRRFAQVTAYDPWRGDDLWRVELWRNAIMEVCDADGDGVEDLLTLEWADEIGPARVAVRSGRDSGAREPTMSWSRARAPDGSQPRAYPVGRTICARDRADRPIVVVGGPWNERLVAYDGPSGRVVWTAVAAEPIVDVVRLDGYDGARFVAITAASLEAFDAGGRAVWKKDVDLWPRGDAETIERWLEPLAVARSRSVSWATPTIADTVPGEDLLLLAGPQKAPVLRAYAGHDGTARWGRPATRYEDLGRTAASLDIDGDGGRDQIVASATGFEVLDVTTGQPRWSKQAKSPEPWELPRLLQVDGGPVVAVAERGGLTLYEARDGSVRARLDDTSLTSPPRAMDWDGNGTLDLVAGVQGADVVAWDGRLQRLGAVPMPVDVSHVDTGRDGDGDGFVDVLAEARGPAVLAGPKVRWRRRYDDAVRASAVVADVDGDEQLEVVVLAPDDQGRWLHLIDARTGMRRISTSIGGDNVVRRPALRATDRGFDLTFVGGPTLRTMRGYDLKVLASREIGAAWAPPAVADLDGDGVEEILQPLWDPRSELLALGAARLDLRWRAPLPSGGFDAPVVLDVDGDGARDVFASALAGHVLRLDAADGTMRWSTALDGRINYTPAIGDIDGDGGVELLVSPKTPGHDLVVLRASDGEVVARWPELGSRRSRVGLHDADGDGRLEVYSATRTRGLVRIDVETDGIDAPTVTWRHEFVDEDGRQPSSSGPVTLADIDADAAPEVLAGFEDGSVRVLDARTGAVRWVFYTEGGDVEGVPAVVDVDGDGVAEVFVTGHDRQVYCLRHGPGR